MLSNLPRFRFVLGAGSNIVLQEFRVQVFHLHC